MAKKEYTNGTITVVWEDEKCIHSAKCVSGLPEVFDTQKRPWISINAANSEAIQKQVDLCPSKALSWYFNDSTASKAKATSSIELEVLANGPLLLSGAVQIKHPDGQTEILDSPALCRCGASANKPFCDGSHRKIDFQG